MEFSEKLMTLRRREGFSQEQLADRLGVTRQSVSKWESGAATPELVKLIALSELFGVSVDYLVKDYLEEPGRVQPEGETSRLEDKIDDLAREYKRSWGPYFSYTSRARIFGLPLVSIRFGRDRHPSRNTLAVGIIAVGNFSVGLISVGLISLGGLSLGMITFGGLALGCVSIGVAALGVTAMGLYAAGVAAMGCEVAVGVAANGPVAIGQEAAGKSVLLWGDGLTHAQAEAFLLENHPKLWEPLLHVLSFFAAHIR